jgi:hypothetical protein
MRGIDHPKSKAVHKNRNYTDLKKTSKVSCVHLYEESNKKYFEFSG